MSPCRSRTFRRPPAGRRAAAGALLALAGLLAAPVRSAGSEAAGPPGPHAVGDHEQVLEAWRAGVAADSDWLVEPGVAADRKGRRVYVWARATGLKASRQCEFFLISPGSGKDYEALAVAYAQPSRVHAALEFIGMPAGRPISRRTLAFWPKGERVIGRCEWIGPDGAPRSARIEDLIRDTGTGATLPRDGLVFVGSQTIPAPGVDTGTVYAADYYDPGSIASAYNEAGTVLDVPRRLAQSEVYERQFPNPEPGFAPDQPLRFVFEPERPDGPPRVLDLRLRLVPAGTEAAGPVRYELTGPDGADLNPDGGTVGMLAAFGRAVAEGRDPFVAVEPDEALPLREVRAAYELLAGLESFEGIRLEPPAEGHLFHEAFRPRPTFRRREDRPSSAWELILDGPDAAAGGTLNRIRRVRDEAGAIRYEATPFAVPGPEALRAELAVQEPGVRVILIFAPAGMTYGDLRAYARVAQATHPVLYVLLPEDE